jgi:hypothetical protein
MVLNIGPPDVHSALAEDSEDGTDNGARSNQADVEMNDSDKAGKASRGTGGKRGAAKGGKRATGGRSKKVSR